MQPRKVTLAWPRTPPSVVNHLGCGSGSGMDGIDGLAVGDPVTTEQMRALFGCGLHPLAELRQQQLEGPDLTARDFQNATRLGAPFKIVDHDLISFRVKVAKRIAALNTAIGWPADASIAAADRAGADSGGPFPRPERLPNMRAASQWTATSFRAPRCAYVP
jgi:hypothetical protein